MFLASGLVPAYTIAAFAKRFARLALSASPAGGAACSRLLWAHIHLQSCFQGSCRRCWKAKLSYQRTGMACYLTTNAQQCPAPCRPHNHLSVLGLTCCLHGAGALVAAAFVHNLLRRHPACNVLLHRPSPRAAQQPPQNGAAAAPAMASGDALEDEPIANGDELAAQQEVGPAAGEDPYLAEEVDPAETCATESSLWEIATLRNHYAPEVWRSSPMYL